MKMVMHEHRQEFAGSQFTAMKMLAAYALRSERQAPQSQSDIVTNETRYHVIDVHPIEATSRRFQGFAGHDQERRISRSLLGPQRSRDQVGVACTKQIPPLRFG